MPSNFVEKLSGDDLLEFHRSVVLANEEIEDDLYTVVPNNLPDEEHLTEELSPEPDYIIPCMLLGTRSYFVAYGFYFLDEDNHLLNATYMSPEDEYPKSVPQSPIEPTGSSVPAPCHLTLERQLNKSILISWQPPESCNAYIEMYHVYVDGFLRTTVQASDKTKALVEGVDNARVSLIILSCHLHKT